MLPFVIPNEGHHEKSLVTFEAWIICECILFVRWKIEEGSNGKEIQKLGSSMRYSVESDFDIPTGSACRAFSELEFKALQTPL